jgi:polysaccharide pyruvyl transferase WcaK-like protein
VKNVAFLGHFGSTNFGNEATLQAVVHRLRRSWPQVSITCICSDPGAAELRHGVYALPLTAPVLPGWAPTNRVVRLLRSVVVGAPSEPYRWLKMLSAVRRFDALIIPGTGLLTDAAGLRGWGPYNVFKWTLLAKLSGCRVVFLSVGAGPLYGFRGRLLVRGALALANVRSFRDASSKQCLAGVGIDTDHDPVYPDLVFGLAGPLERKPDTSCDRPVVGLGLMSYAGRYSAARPSPRTYERYLDSLVELATHVVAAGYDVRLLIGDLADVHATEDFMELLRASDEQLPGHVLDEPPSSVERLIAQIASTDLVVATRFHNVLLAMACEKPVVAISFHHKCDSLMEAMGLSDYCLGIDDLTPAHLIERFRALEREAESLELLIGTRATVFRADLEEQYLSLFGPLDPRYGPCEPGRPGPRGPACPAPSLALS